MYSMSSAVRTNKGNIRQNNEDNFYIYDTYAQIEEADTGCAHRKFVNDDFQIYAICDGMGGCDLGEVAAYTVVSHLNQLKDLLKTTDKKLLSEQVKSFLESMNTKCREIITTEIGTGCTIAMICIIKKHIYVVNAGDSRVYLWQKSKFTQLTYDHTYAQLLYSNGEITKESMAAHPQNNVLIQYIGIPETYIFDPYISMPFKIKRGDTFILCSDGLTDMVDDDNISETLLQFDAPFEICKSLISKALSKGGEDNVTVMAVKCINC